MWFLLHVFHLWCVTYVSLLFGSLTVWFLSVILLQFFSCFAPHIYSVSLKINYWSIRDYFDELYYLSACCLISWFRSSFLCHSFYFFSWLKFLLGASNATMLMILCYLTFWNTVAAVKNLSICLYICCFCTIGCWFFCYFLPFFEILCYIWHNPGTWIELQVNTYTQIIR